MNFISILPDINDEVAIKIIEQFPEFSKTASTMLDIVRQQFDSILLENGRAVDHSVSAYRKVLDDFSLMMQLPDISEQQRRYFAEKMLEAADRISAKDTENKEFLGNAAGTLGKIALGALGICAGLLGYKFINDNFL